jgi:uncharacterized protein (UPF0248 family)
MVMSFEVLNKLKWKGGLDGCEIIILHRGAPRDRKTIQGSQVTDLDRHYFYYSESGRETTIPLHRIREIWLDRKLVWKREEKPEKRD